MPAMNTWQYRPLTGAASTIVLSAVGGAVLGGVWVSSKQATGVVIAFDTTSTTPTLNKFVASTLSLPKGRTMIEAETGFGLVIKTASVVGAILWRPSGA